MKQFTAQQINMMPKSARPIGVEPLSEKEFREKYADRVRKGKTARDHSKKHK